MRTVGVVTSGRSDYGAYLPILRAIQAEPQLRLHLLVTGMHLSPHHGLTVKAIESDQIPIADRIELPLASDTPEGIATSMGVGTMGFARSYARCRPDVLLVLGDRFEVHAAVAAAAPFTIPVAHIHGGETTQGAIDDLLRHSITKLSHLHFVATDEYARRIIEMGEELWRVTVSGAPALDQLATVRLLSRQELQARLGLRIEDGLLLVTYHPVTMEFEQTEWQIRELLAALEACGRPVVFTMPNADTHGSVIRRLIQEFVAGHPGTQAVTSLGIQAYWSLMAEAAAMIGNSSSGLIEAPSFGLPVVNIGTRQAGRLRAENVIDVGYDQASILRGIRRALELEFRTRLRGLPNPYGDGHAAERIVNRLKEVPLDERLLVKHSARPARTPAQPALV